MKRWDGYQKGVNLGGWLSQSDHTKQTYDTYIKQEDIQRIAMWGVDHVRLPIDYNLVQREDGSFIEENFKYIDDCISWCGEAGLNMILDVHSASGYSFDADDGSGEGFFKQEDKIEMFIALWTELTKRYVKYDDRVAFELLNEVVNECDNAPWMEIAKRTVDLIRGYSKDIKILIGAYYNNSIMTVKYIAPPFDENIVYNVHCYEPLFFTHQGAYWVKTMPPDFRMAYPFTKEEYIKQASAVDESYLNTVWAMEDGVIDIQYFENLFAEAIQIANDRDVYLYCGEYGVIDLVDAQSTLNWIRDIHGVFDKYGIGRSIWNYKGKDFGLLDDRLDSVRDELYKCL
ncbi:MAG: cellulase family glycosylhydrolase [Eubacteriales bacterium]|nr:cellulase family glycosylhydrolase [Eubacteriales bacterium]